MARELTREEKRAIHKLVKSLCANYDKDYGCLPLDCECYMLGKCWTGRCAATSGRLFCPPIRRWRRPYSPMALPRKPGLARSAAGPCYRMAAHGIAPRLAPGPQGVKNSVAICGNTGDDV